MERLKLSGRWVDKWGMEKTTDEKVAEIVAELKQLKERLDRIERQQKDSSATVAEIKRKLDSVRVIG